MKVLVTGGTGFLGSEVVRAALAQGHEVTVLTRNVDALSPGPNLRVIVGDARDAPAVSAALDGQDAVIHSVGASSSSAPLGRANARRKDGTDLFSVTTCRLVYAMRRQGVRRLIAVSNVGVGDSANALPWIMRRVLLPWLAPFLLRVMADKEQMEKIIRDSGLDWTIVRLNGILKGPAKGKLRVAEGKVGLFITAADAADFLVQQVDQELYLGRAPSVSN